MPDPMPSTTIGRTRRPPYEPPRYRPRRSRFLLVGLPMFAVFAAFASIVWLAYVDGAPGSAMGEPPLIKADASPLRLSPDDPGGRVVADQGEVRELFRDEPVAQPELLLPPPEEPITALVEAEPTPPEESAPALDQRDPVAPAPEPEPPAGQDFAATTGQVGGPALPAPAGQAAATDGRDDGIEAAEDPEAALDALLAEVTGTRTEPAERPVPAQAAEAPASEQAARPPAPAEAEPPPAQQAATDVRPAVSVPVPQRSEPSESRPARAERQPEIAAIAPGEPLREPQAPAQATGPAQAAAPPAQDPVPAVQPAPSQGASTGPNYRIQLAAVREETDARRAWDLFQLDLGDVLSGVDPIIERAETANGIFYRVQVGPFANLASAETLCDRLKQRNASCFVIRR